MASEWFRLPMVDADPNDPPDSQFRPPKYMPDYDVAYACNQAHPEGAPVYVCRAFGDQSTLDSIAAEPDSVSMTDADVETALNGMASTGLSDADISTWNESFHVG